MSKSPLLSAISNVHYTPSYVVDKSRKFLGDIYLDAASDAIANRLIQAKEIFTIEDDGYNQDWIADTVFCNPPGRTSSNLSIPGASDWFHKMRSEYDKGHFREGIYVGYNIEVLAKIGRAVEFLPMCVPQSDSHVTTGMGRLKFEIVDANGDRVPQKQPQHGNVIICFPDKNNRLERAIQFRKLFNYLGWVVIPVVFS